jgi:hypothetical protein
MWRTCPSAPLLFSLLPSISDQTVCWRFSDSVLWCSLTEFVHYSWHRRNEGPTLGMWINFFLYFPHLLSIWVKFGITDMHIILFRNCQFWRNRCRKDHTFLMSVSEIAVWGCHINVRHFESTEHVGKVFELSHGHTICNADVRIGWGRVIWICLNYIDSKTLLQIFLKYHANLLRRTREAVLICRKQPHGNAACWKHFSSESRYSSYSMWIK